MNRYSWILFDADHTLFDFDRASEESLAEVLAAHGSGWEEGMYADYKRINVQCWTEHEQGKIDRDTLVYERFRRYFAFRQLNLDPVLTQQEYLRRLGTKTYLMPGAAAILEQLEGGYRLGYITNGMKEVQRPRLERVGWVEKFNVIVIGGEVGLSKPSEAYFKHVHTLMDEPPHDEVLVVGDSLSADIAGAAAFGYRTCWYNPGKEPCHLSRQPDHTVSHLNEILKILAPDSEGSV